MSDNNDEQSKEEMQVPVENEKPSEGEQEKKGVNLLEIPVNNEHDALNVLVGFVGLAQRRGCFAINESAKIFECIKQFHSTQ